MAVSLSVQIPRWPILPLHSPASAYICDPSKAEARMIIDPASASSTPENAIVVGLGASAGGLEAILEFFDGLPDEPGMSFVVITHLAHSSVSALPELIRSHTKMPVLEAQSGMRLEPNRVLVSPPGVIVGVMGGTLQIFAPRAGDPRPLPIDFFFRSLAQEYKANAVGIVLSGAGTDGTNGLREIKAASGLVMTQDAASARFPDMPQAASLAVEPDFVLPPSRMAAQLLDHLRRARHSQVALEADSEKRDVLTRIFLLLRQRTGHDFSHYKLTTIERRLSRRLHVHQLESLSDYLRYVQTNPHELDVLFKELLIGVTSFFRDVEAFELLASNILAPLLEARNAEEPLRAWVTGCSTGEEAYSLAMLLREQLGGAHAARTAIQLFATDLDPRAIEVARAGVYPATITSDVTPERLERFFSPDNGYYRVCKEIRDLLVFAVQDLIADPPFTKLDLIVCRNLLIYLNADIQKRLIPLFHYALRPGGVLFLGSSETIGEFSHLFEPVHKKWKLFRRREVAPGTYTANVPASRSNGSAREASTPVSSRKHEFGFSHIAERAILQNLVPPTLLMHESGEIVHIQGRTGLYLEPAPGSQTHPNVYAMAREGLQLELTLAVRQAREGHDVVQRAVRVRTNGDFSLVNLRVKQLQTPEAVRGLYLVTFEACPEPKGVDVPAQSSNSEEKSPREQQLERELMEARQARQSSVEQLETTNEELKSANEELQSMNEELQSANEELETSKEEMQSLNEELQTVNAELQGKVEELSRSNDDMTNLLNSTDIATVFLDNELNIKRYTEQAKRLIRLIPSDIGRSIGDLVSNLNYSALVTDAAEVLRTLAFKEVEVQAADGRWYLVRMLPYRTMENMIDGLVVTFVDVTKVRGLQQQTERLLAALTSSPTSIFRQNADFKYEWALGSLLGKWPTEIAGKTDEDLLPPLEASTLTTLKRRVLEHGARIHQRLELARGDGGRGVYDLYLERIEDAESGKSPAGREASAHGAYALIGVLTQLSDTIGTS
jgi:two-component system CheB/CheR fusion protein